MVWVDSHGRIVLPKQVRDRLSITPGTEVEIHEENGKIIVEPADSPEQRIERMERLVAETAPEQRDTTPPVEGPASIAQKHRDAIRRGVEESDSG